MNVIFWAQQLPIPVTPLLLDRVGQIIAFAVLLVLQSVWQRRIATRSMDDKMSALTTAMDRHVTSLRAAIGFVGDNAETGFIKTREEITGLGHRVEVWSEKTMSIGKTVDGLLDRERAHLEDDANATRRRRR